LIDFDTLAEKRIVEAIGRGELDGLPGSGRPLDLDSDALVPPEVRVAHRILKNAGLAPPEILERRELAELEGALGTLQADARRRALGKLALLRTRLEARGMHRHVATSGYTARIVEKLARGA
jgi:hypothetical protein